MSWRINLSRYTSREIRLRRALTLSFGPKAFNQCGLARRQEVRHRDVGPEFVKRPRQPRERFGTRPHTRMGRLKFRDGGLWDVGKPCKLLLRQTRFISFFSETHYRLTR